MPQGELQYFFFSDFHREKWGRCDAKMCWDVLLSTFVCIVLGVNSGIFRHTSSAASVEAIYFNEKQERQPMISIAC